MPHALRPQHDMAKRKTHKAVWKRFRLTGRKRLLRRAAGQDHFNARESGKITKKKRRDRELHPADYRRVRIAIPYR